MDREFFSNEKEIKKIMKLIEKKLEMANKNLNEVEKNTFYLEGLLNKEEEFSNISYIYRGI